MEGARERDNLIELHHKAVQELKVHKGQIVEQASFLRTIAEEADLLRGDQASAREDYKNLRTENARVASELTLPKEELARVTLEAKRREETFKSETDSLRNQVISSQGSLLQATVYKLIRTNIFGEYVNA